MKHIKLFEELNVTARDFIGYELSPREKQRLVNIFGKKFLKSFMILKEDNSYYISYFSAYFNKFDSFNDLKDYLSAKYYLFKNEPNKLLN